MHNSNPNLNLILTLTLKPSLNSQTAIIHCEDRQKCPHSQCLKLKMILIETEVQVHTHTHILGVTDFRSHCTFLLYMSLSLSKPLKNSLLMRRYCSVQMQILFSNYRNMCHIVCSFTVVISLITFHII